ncbi:MULTISPECIES: protein kinase domain-containing protein [Streptomyces]|uniref:protein kinase domain-containing protein n=1 Tax=Streptomyces TaxID=1883 RepID=UPI00186AC97A|nr:MULTISPECIES: protein kinase [Streptomyces]
MQPLRADDPERIADYRLLGRLGEGGMGVVFLARSPRGRMVAVKTIRAEFADVPDFRRRFARETAVAQRVGGRWTADVLAADPDAALPWVATEYVAGLTLQQVVDEYGPLPAEAVTALAVGLCHALGAIHGAGLVHRDLKPSNIMVTIEGPRVIDFGIVRALDLSTAGSVTATGRVIGSPGFMSPEQARGERLTDASDVFSLGAVLAFAATGRLPFHAESGQPAVLLYRVVHEEPDLSGVPAPLRELIASCLAKAPADRPKPAELRNRNASPPAGPWLPPEVLARLGQEAVRLLEHDDPRPPATPPPDAPTETAHRSVSPPPTVPATGPTATPAATPASAPTTTPAATPAPTAVTAPTPAPRLLVDERRRAGRWSTTHTYSGVLYVMLTQFTLVTLASAVHLWLISRDEGEGNAVGDIGDLWIRQHETIAYLLLAARTLAGVGLIVCWLLWFHQVRVTAERFVPGGLRYRTRTAVTNWFVPLGNLFLPKQIANDVWHASSPPRPDGRMAPAGLLNTWWALWLATFLTWPLFWFPWTETVTVDSASTEVCRVWEEYGCDPNYLVDEHAFWYEFEPLTWVNLGLHLLVVPTTVVTILFVRRLTTLQAARPRD